VNRQQIIVDTLFPMTRVPAEGLTVKHIHTGTRALRRRSDADTINQLALTD
jgi:hypothetical protein